MTTPQDPEPIPELVDTQDDILMLIAAELPPRSMLALQTTCKRLYLVLSQEEMVSKWLWKRACLHQPGHDPRLVERFTRHNKLASVTVAEHLCSWAGQLHEQQANDADARPPSGSVLGLDPAVCIWLVQGLVQLQHGQPLMQWLLEHETAAASPDCHQPRRLYQQAMTTSLQFNLLESLQLLLGGRTATDAIQEAHLTPTQAIEAAARGGAMDTFAWCMGALQPDANMVSSAVVAAALHGQHHILTSLQSRGLLHTSPGAHVALIAAVQRNHVLAAQVLLGCQAYKQRPHSSTAAGGSTQQPGGARARVCTHNCPGAQHPIILEAFLRSCETGSTDCALMLLDHMDSLPYAGGDAVLVLAREGYTELLRSMLSHPACTWCMDEGVARAALLEACRNGHTDAVALLLQHPDVQREVRDVHTAALREAAQHGAAQTLTYLLSHPIGAVAQGTLNEALLHATLHGETVCMTLLLEAGAQPGWNNGILFDTAGRNGHESAVRLLLQWGAVTSTQMWTAAVFSAAQAGNAKVLSELLGWAETPVAAQPATSTRRHSTHHITSQDLAASLPLALRAAAQRGHAEVCRIVLGIWCRVQACKQERGMLAQEIKADADAVAQALVCCLTEAAHGKHLAVCTWAVQQLLDPSASMLDQQSRLEHLEDGAKSVLGAALGQGDVRVLECLLEVPAIHDRLCVEDVQRTAQQGLVECSRLLLQAGVDWGDVLCHAAMSGDVTAVATLLAAEGGQAPLSSAHWPQDALDRALCTAAEAGQQDTAQLLLAGGADVNTGGGAPLAGALRAGNFKLTKLLLDKGAPIQDAVGAEELRSLAERGCLDVLRLVRPQC